MLFTKNNEGIRASWATKYKKYVVGIYSSQKMVQQVWIIKLDWKDTTFFYSGYH